MLTELEMRSAWLSYALATTKHIGTRILTDLARDYINARPVLWIVRMLTVDE